MKKTFTLLTIVTSIAVLFAACKRGASTTPVSTEDTVGFAAFKQLKLQQEQEAAAALYAKSMAANITVAKKNSSTSGTMSSTSTNNAKVETRKKGMSKSAKYAIIGGTGGAVLGAVINKRNRVAGGVIGGVLGGGLGYGIGRKQDKKDGRIE